MYIGEPILVTFRCMRHLMSTPALNAAAARKAHQASTRGTPQSLATPATPTTRRHPRTLEEAFGPYAWGRPSARPRRRLLPWTGVVLRLLGIVLGLTVVAHLIAWAL